MFPFFISEIVCIKAPPISHNVNKKEQKRTAANSVNHLLTMDSYKEIENIFYGQSLSELCANLCVCIQCFKRSLNVNKRQQQKDNTKSHTRTLSLYIWSWKLASIRPNCLLLTHWLLMRKRYQMGLSISFVHSLLFRCICIALDRIVSQI